MDDIIADITVEVCGENGAWYKVCIKILSQIPQFIQLVQKNFFDMMPKRILCAIKKNLF